MTFGTHRQFAVFWSLIGAMVLYASGMTEINYYLALFIIIPFAKIGAEFPDYDHAWQNIKHKTVASWVVNKLIHLTGGTHRSWQTHSIDIATAATLISYFLPNWLYHFELISEVNREVLGIILLGFSVGWLSHIFSDMLTAGKVKPFAMGKKWIGLVPTRIFKFKFSTGSEWESFVYSVTRLLNILVGFISVIFPLVYKGQGIQFISDIIKFLKF